MIVRFCYMMCVNYKNIINVCVKAFTFEYNARGIRRTNTSSQ